ncbi:MAG: GH3 auxin-responsive promoter family protein [Chloroflexota bacterium]
MPKAVELLRQGRDEELWQMCCGFISLNLEQFMAIQRRLLLEQLELLSRSRLGRKIMRGDQPRTVAEFRQQIPLTTYQDYCPELSEQREDTLPVKPDCWVHTSGRSGEYPCEWVPLTPAYAEELSRIMYGVGILASSRGWGDVSAVPGRPRIVYTVAPRPYFTGALAGLLAYQTPTDYLPSADIADGLPFEERIKLGFEQALSRGIDYFFGLSLVLAAVGEKFSQPQDLASLRPFLSRPRALLRLARGLARSKIARRPLLPRDLWSVRGIISGGLDSGVYRDTIKHLWGKYPLDTYTSTEGGIMATQTWDYGGMTFIPTLNFLEFIPEKEHFKWQLDHRYQPKTVLLDEVTAGENYEIVITNFHGGALVRYRLGDMVRITARRNDKLGIELPQMVFERRADDLLDFVVIRLTEKSIWQAIENTGIPYQDWAATKQTGEPVLNLYLEPKNGCRTSPEVLARAVHEQLTRPSHDSYTTSVAHDDLSHMINFRVKVTLLPRGAFAGYIARRQAEGADLAHLKPPHINPPERVLASLLARPVTRVTAPTKAMPVAVP